MADPPLRGEQHGRAAHLVERAAALLRAEAGLHDGAVNDAWSEADAPKTDAPEANTPEANTPAAEVAAPAPVSTLLPPPPAESSPAAGAVPTPAAEPAEPPMPAAAAATPVAAPTLAPAAEPLLLEMATLQRAGLVLTGKRSRIAEEYRVTVSRALRALRGSRSGRAGTANLLMVTSARPGEGKSFSSLNIAASIAQNGLSDVLLVDVDAKPRSLSALLGLGGREGLLDLAVGTSATNMRPPETLLVRTAIEGLSFLPVGARRPGAEGAITRAVSTTLERLARRFPRHVIVLDTAPCLSTSDPSTLASIVDQVLLVVEAERTQRSEVEAALDLLKAASNVTLMLNKVQLTQRHSFGSYYYFDEPG